MPYKDISKKKRNIVYGVDWSKAFRNHVKKLQRTDKFYKTFTYSCLQTNEDVKKLFQKKKDAYIDAYVKKHGFATRQEYLRAKGMADRPFVFPRAKSKRKSDYKNHYRRSTKKNTYYNRAMKQQMIGGGGNTIAGGNPYGQSVNSFGNALKGLPQPYSGLPFNQ